MPGVNLNITLPTVSSTVGPAYATEINAAIQALIDDVEADILPGEISMNDTLDMNGQNLDNLSKAVFTALSSSPSSGTDFIFFQGGEFWARAGSSNVQITASGALNASALAGIGGDYSSSAADVSYFNSSKSYVVRDEDSFYSKFEVADIYLKKIAASGNHTILKRATTLTTSIDWIFPSSNPSSGDEIVTIDSTGQVSHGQDVAAFSVASNADITLQGTGKLNHPETSKCVGPSGMHELEPTSTSTMTGSRWEAGTANLSQVLCDIGKHVPVGAKITKVEVRNYKSAGTSTDFSIRSYDSTGETIVITNARTSTTGWDTEVVTPGADITIVTATHYIMYWDPDHTDDVLLLVEVFYKQD